MSWRRTRGWRSRACIRSTRPLRGRRALLTTWRRFRETLYRQLKVGRNAAGLPMMIFSRCNTGRRVESSAPGGSGGGLKNGRLFPPRSRRSHICRLQSIRDVGLFPRHAPCHGNDPALAVQFAAALNQAQAPQPHGRDGSVFFSCEARPRRRIHRFETHDAPVART